MRTCGSVEREDGAHCVDPRCRPSLPGSLHEHRRPGRSLSLRAHESLADDDIFVVKVFFDTAAKLESDHVFVLLDVVNYRRPALVS